MRRDAFLIRLRRYARKSGLSIKVDTKKGKGSHYGVTVGARQTVVQSGELSPFLVARICKQLDIDPCRL